MTVAQVHRRPLIAIAWRGLAIVVLGGGAGFLVNLVHPRGVKVQWYEPPTMCTASAAQAVHIATLPPTDAAKWCGNAQTLVADVRDAESYARGHIAGAVHIPCTGSEADVGRVVERLSGKQSLVVYGETDEQSQRVASDLAQRIGRPELNIVVILGGWNAWFNAGLACSSGPCDDCEAGASHAKHN